MRLASALPLGLERGFEGGALRAAYKAVWYVDEDSTEYPAIKTAGSKSTWPGKKTSSSLRMNHIQRTINGSCGL